MPKLVNVSVDYIHFVQRKYGVDKTRIGSDRTRPDHRPDHGSDHRKKNKVLKKKKIQKNGIVYEIIIIKKKKWVTKIPVCQVKIRNVSLQAKVKSARQVS